MIHVIYLTIIFLLTILCTYICKKIYELSMIIFKIEDSLEESLNILDERYKKMNEILQTPVFFDSIEVRTVINEIKLCYDSVLIIANKLTNSLGKDGETKEKNDQN